MGKFVPTIINTEDPKIAAVVKEKKNQELQKQKELEKKLRKSNRRKNTDEKTADNFGYSQEKNRVRNSSSERDKEPSKDGEVPDSSIGLG